ncbi:MAG: hypothetical protein IJF66_01510 [Clostridia bacterium]|nr:hypothetical protein [Clostridia bacterium]
MKNRVIIILVACLMACSVIGICFATYYVNAQKSIVISTGNSKTLTITASTDGGALNPEHPVTYDVILDVPKDDLGGYSAYAGLQGKFYIEVNSTNALTEVTTITMYDGLTDYNLSQMEEGIYYNLEDLPQILVITFSVEDFNITIAEQEIEITMYWDFVEWAPSAGSTYLLGTYGNLENVWAPTYECTTLGADPDEVNYAEIEGLALEAGDIIKLYVQGWDDASWISWKTDAASLGNWAEYDVNGNLVIKEAGTYNIYLSTSDGNGAYVTKD